MPAAPSSEMACVPGPGEGIPMEWLSGNLSKCRRPLLAGQLAVKGVEVKSHLNFLKKCLLSILSSLWN